MEGIRPKGAAEFDGYIMPEPVKEVTPETIARRTELHRLLLQTVAEVKEHARQRSLLEKQAKTVD